MLPTDKLVWVRGAARRRDSGNMRSHYLVALNHFEEFCVSTGLSIEEEVNLCLEGQRRGERRVYRTLTDFVGWLQAKELRATTIEGYVSGAKAYLLDQDVEILNEVCRRRVKLPMKYPVPDEVPDKETIRKLVGGKVNPKLKTLIMLLASSGIRLQEALKTRVRDYEFDEQPPRVRLAGQITKTGQPREAYLTRETAAEIKKLNRKPDEYVFDFMDMEIPAKSKLVEVKGEEGYRIYMAEKKASQMLRRRVNTVLGEDKLLSEGHRIHTIHFHVFRDYVLGVASEPDHGIGKAWAHILLGHKMPWPEVYDYDQEALRKLYWEKLEPRLTVFGVPTASAQDVGDLQKQLKTLVGENQRLWDTVHHMQRFTMMQAFNSDLTFNVLNRGGSLKLATEMKSEAAEMMDAGDLFHLSEDDANTLLGQIMEKLLQKHNLWKTS